MSFQTEVLRRYGGFEVRLGRRGNLQFTAEESDLQLNLRQDGFELYYQPQATVWHLVGEMRQKPEYLIHRSYAHGQSDAMRYVLRDWPGRYTLLKLMVRQAVRMRDILVQSWRSLPFRIHDAISSEQYLIRCRLAELFGYERQMIELLFRRESFSHLGVFAMAD